MSMCSEAASDRPNAGTAALSPPYFGSRCVTTSTHRSELWSTGVIIGIGSGELRTAEVIVFLL